MQGDNANAHPAHCILARMYTAGLQISKSVMLWFTEKHNEAILCIIALDKLREGG